MRPASRVVLMVVLAAAVFLGPLVMLVDGCAAMLMCDAPCGVMCGAVFAAPTLSPLAALSAVVVVSAVSPMPAPPAVLEPPPKSALLSL